MAGYGGDAAAAACAGRMLKVQAWGLVTAATDLRCGMDRLLLQGRMVLGREPAGARRT